MRRKLMLAVLAVAVPAGFSRAADPLPVARTAADGVAAYRTARKLAEGGTRVVLVLGTETGMLRAEDKDVYRFIKFTDSDGLKGLPPGVYDCSKGADGQPQMVRRVPQAVPAVPSFQPAPGPSFGFQVVGPFGNTLGVCVGRT